MKLLYKRLNKGSGSVGLLPETDEDLWHAFQLIQIGDQVKTTTFRKVVINEGSSEGPSSARTSKVRTTLNIEVEEIDFQPEGHELRVRGKNIEENEYVRVGSFHTLDIEPNRKFTITKAEWDEIAFDILHTACDPARTADIAAVVMHEGLANVCLITNAMTILRCKLDVNIPRKRRNHCANHDKAMVKFYDSVAQAIVRHVDFAVVKVCILASPGFLKEQLLSHMMQLASKQPTVFKVLADNRDKFVLAHSSNGFKSAIDDVLRDPAIVKQMADTKAVAQVRDLHEFYSLLYSDPSKAMYGIMRQIEAANDASAIKIFMVTDEFLRKASAPLRQRLSTIMNGVKAINGTVRIFSVLHSSGEQLSQLGGMAAILRFPMPELLEMEEEEGEGEEKNENA